MRSRFNRLRDSLVSGRVEGDHVRNRQQVVEREKLDVEMRAAAGVEERS